MRTLSKKNRSYLTDLDLIFVLHPDLGVKLDILIQTRFLSNRDRSRWVAGFNFVWLAQKDGSITLKEVASKAKAGMEWEAREVAEETARLNREAAERKRAWLQRAKEPHGKCSPLCRSVLRGVLERAQAENPFWHAEAMGLMSSHESMLIPENDDDWNEEGVDLSEALDVALQFLSEE